MPDTVAQRYVGFNIWVYVAQLGLTLLFALLPMCGNTHLSAEYRISPEGTVVDKNSAVQMMRDPLMPGEEDEEGDRHPDEVQDAGPFPEYRTNIVSRVCFCWVCPILKKGRKSALQFKDIWRLDGNDKTDVAAVRLLLSVSVL